MATQGGYISDIDALVVGRVAVDLGAGRRVADEAVEPRAGIWFHKKVGGAVKEGEVVATLYTQIEEEDAVAPLVQRVAQAIQYSSTPVQEPPIVTHVVTSKDGTKEFVMPKVLQNMNEGLLGIKLF